MSIILETAEKILEKLLICWCNKVSPLQSIMPWHFFSHRHFWQVIFPLSCCWTAKTKPPYLILDLYYISSYCFLSLYVIQLHVAEELRIVTKFILAWLEEWGQQEFGLGKYSNCHSGSLEHTLKQKFRRLVNQSMGYSEYDKSDQSDRARGGRQF